MALDAVHAGSSVVSGELADGFEGSTLVTKLELLILPEGDIVGLITHSAGWVSASIQLFKIIFCSRLVLVASYAKKVLNVDGGGSDCCCCGLSDLI